MATLNGDPRVLAAALEGEQHVVGLCRQALHVCLELNCLLPAAWACNKPAAHAASMMGTPDKTHRLGAGQAYFSAFLLCSCCCSVPSLPAPA